jgi:hypothetical protein
VAAFGDRQRVLALPDVHLRREAALESATGQLQRCPPDDHLRIGDRHLVIELDHLHVRARNVAHHREDHALATFLTGQELGGCRLVQAP